MSGFYEIKSKLTGFVLDIQGGHGAGAKVIPYEHHGKDNQVWYDDQARGVICSKAGNYVLAVTNNQLCVEDYQQGKASQQWARDGQYIRNRVDRNKVLDIFDNNKEKGAKIGEYQFNGGANQSWDFVNVAGQPPVTGGAPHAQASTAYPAYPGYPQAGAARREFYITSKMHGKVLDISRGNKDAGTKICVWDKHSPPAKNQHWYVDQQGCIRSSLNDMQFAGKPGESLHMTQTSDASSQWSFQGEKIVNREGKCLDIRGGDDDKGTELCAYEYKNQKNQHWTQEFI